jgi:hypothetical protein
MKKKVIITTIALIFTVFFWGGPSAIKAESDDNVGAVVTKDFICRIRNGYGEIENVTNSQVVYSPSGNIKLTCHGKVTPNSEVKGPVVFNFENTGKRCGLGNGIVTEDWESKVTPSGQATIQCFFHPNQAQ